MKYRKMRRDDERQDHELWKGLVAGSIAGLLAAYAMNQYQAVWSKGSEILSRRLNGQQGRQETGPNEERSNRGKPNGERPQAKKPQGEDEDATMKMAAKIGETILGRSLTKEEKQKAGPIVHYGFGAAMGALYGVSAEVNSKVKAGLGIPFGAALFVGADEIMVPALGLSKPATAYPLSTHVYGLTSHFVYGLSTELVRRAVRSGF